MLQKTSIHYFYVSNVLAEVCALSFVSCLILGQDVTDFLRLPIKATQTSFVIASELIIY